MGKRRELLQVRIIMFRLRKILKTILAPILLKNKALRVPWITKFYVALKKEKLMYMWIWGEKIMKDAIDEQFEIFLPPEKLCDNAYCNQLVVDIISSYFLYDATPAEYFLFDFPNCNHQRRKSFLTLKHKDEMMIRKVGMGYNWDILEDKEMFYEKFKEYFRRDVCIIKESKDLSQFKNILSKHSKCIAKPINGQCGKGVKVIEKVLDIDTLFSDMLKQGKWIVEELLYSDLAISQLNPSSLNTVRIPSFINKSGFTIFKPVLRIGRKVDNANSGGIIVTIDAKSGVVLTDGVDMKGRKYKQHPDSNILLKGFQIPQWNELVLLVERIHTTIMPNYPYIGWDFALTQNGWVLIEGNWGQFLSEFSDREGIKESFDKLFD